MNLRIFVLILILIPGIFLAGCTNQAGQAEPDKKTRENPGTPGAGESMDASGERSMVSHETMPLNSTRDVFLKENPTTGFQWNASVTKGLIIETDEYTADPVKPGIVGSGGMHHWVIRAVEKGNQTFNAEYKRSWESLTGNETRYFLYILVE